MATLLTVGFAALQQRLSLVELHQQQLLFTVTPLGVS